MQKTYFYTSVYYTSTLADGLCEDHLSLIWHFLIFFIFELECFMQLIIPY